MDFYGINAKANIKTEDVTDLLINNEVDGGTIALKADDGGGSSQFLLKGDPDGQLQLYYDGAIKAWTTSNGIAGAVWG